jgi:hypothetical protein
LVTSSRSGSRYMLADQKNLTLGSCSAVKATV